MKKILILFFTLLIASNIYSQNEINISGGIGFSEFLNIGLHYNIDQYEFGISGGSWLNKDLLSIVGDIRFHFGDSSAYTKIKPWYLLFGINYIKDDGNITDHKYYYLSIRIGREFNFSKKIGIDLNLGFLGEVSHEEKRKSCFNCPLGGVDLPTLPAISLRLFYRI